MELSILLPTVIGTVAVLLVVYFGITNTSEFKKKSEADQKKGKIRLKLFLAGAFVLGFIQLLAG